MSDIQHRLHWHRPDAEPPERVTFWRGGIRRDLPRWEQEYVRADLHAGAVEENERLRRWIHSTQHRAVMPFEDCNMCAGLDEQLATLDHLRGQ